MKRANPSTTAGRTHHLLKKAASLHGRGQARAALNLLQRALASDSGNFEALHGTAVIYAQLGDPERALRFIDKAAGVQPDQFAVHYNRGKILQELGHYDEAVASYNKALTLKPDLADAHNNRANTLMQLGRHSEALSDFDRAIAINPTSAESFYNRANALNDLHRHQEAVTDYGRAISLQPDHAEAYNNRGLALNRSDRHTEALADFNHAIALKPDYHEAYNNRGAALQAMARYSDSLTDFDKAISLKPDYAEACNSRGTLLAEMKRHDEALASFDQAITLKPDYVEAYNNRAALLADMNRHDEALASFDQAVSLKPDYAEAYNNRGASLQAVGRYQDATADFDRAIVAGPDYAEARFNKGLLRLLLGNYEQGWPLYEWRWKTADLKPYARAFEQPLWLGDQGLKDKTILLHAEQGLGDAVQFVRYLPMVEVLGARIILEAPPDLVPLFDTLPGSFTLIAAGDPLPPFDLQCPLMSLPLAFNTAVDSIPADIPYLTATPEQQSRWRGRLGPRVRPRVGLAWSGNAAHRNDHNRNLGLQRLTGLLSLDLEYHSLHKEVRAEDQQVLDRLIGVRAHETELHDFSDTAALIGELDLVISVDTAVAHVAGAVGKAVWILLPYAPDHRWMTNRVDSPWYPTARLFRQQGTDDWETVIAEVRSALQSQFPEDPGP